MNRFMLTGSELNNYGGAAHESAGTITTDFATKQRSVQLKDEEVSTTKYMGNYKALEEISDENIYSIIGSK